jgi:cytochrome c oxidase cbb3-type subunit 1
MVFSIVLWMPSWGGMINGLMTLSGAWDKLRTDPIIRMMVISIGFYGMSTFEGPMMSIRAVNSLSPLHRLDHRPRAFRRAGLERHDHLRRALLPGAEALEPRAALQPVSLVNWHFWLATIGIVLYAASMWVTGIMEGLMWREVDAQRASS